MITYHVRCIMLSIIMLCIAIISGTACAASAVSDPSIAQLVIDRSHITPGTSFWVALHIELDKGWHSYWRNPGDSGYATTMDITLPERFKHDDIVWPAPEAFTMQGLTSYGYAHDAWHYMKVTPPDIIEDDKIEVTVRADWLTCKDICIPQSADLSLYVPVIEVPASLDPIFHERLLDIPSSQRTDGEYTVTQQYLYVSLPRLADTLPDSDTWMMVDPDVIVHNATPQIHAEKNRWFVRFKLAGSKELPDSIQLLWRDGSGVSSYIRLHHALDMVVPKYPNKQILKNSDTISEDTGLSLSMALGLAFLGGLILNLMPCVLPVLSLKILQLTTMHGHERRTIIHHGVAYTVGVIASFVMIAVALISLQLAGAQIGWGFQLQSPVVVSLLAMMMLLVGLNLSGMFELPVLFGNTGQHLASKHTPSGSFFTGILAVLVATPCTAPFMAPAMGYALTQPILYQLLIFIALGAGLAAPFLGITLIPSLQRFLPKPGVWMVRLRQFLAFPMYATAAWLVWVLTRQSGDMALLIWLMLAIGVLLGIWALSWITKRMPRIAIWALLIMVTIMSLDSIARLQAVSALNEQTQPFSETLLEDLQRTGKPVFVYATADWCITCKVNERIALNSARVTEYFRAHNVMVLKADWTHHDPVITRFLKRNQRAGVPLYLYYPSSQEAPIVLPQLLTPSIVLEHVRGSLRP